MNRRAQVRFRPLWAAIHSIVDLEDPMTLRRLSIALFAVALPTGASAQITNRAVPAPVYGVTLDDVSAANAEYTALSSLVKVPTARIVFNTGENPAYYKKPIQQFRSVSYIMGELVDSSYMTHYKTAQAVQTWTTNYVNGLGTLVDIWEVGNEINGNWLSKEKNGADVMPKIAAMYDTVSAQGGRTALTFFYEGEPSDPNNCIATDHGGNDMFTWIQQRFLVNPSAETEKIRLGLNYALVSWYPDQCPGESPNWPWVYTQLAAIFPNAAVGFGEVGTANPKNGSAFEINEINTYYPLAKTTAGLPGSYVGAYFWWYFAEEMVPWPGSLGQALNNALTAGP
jgi:hypothetical protein